MNTKRKGFIAICLLLSVISTAVAQPGGKFKNPDHEGPHPKEDHWFLKIAKDLNLSEEQKAKAKDLHETYEKKIKDIAENKSQSLGEFEKKRDELFEERKKAFMEILTTDQRDKLSKMKDDMNDKRESKVDEKIKKMSETLNLNEEQKIKINAINEVYKSKRQSVFSNTTLTPEQRKASMQDLNKAEKEEISGVLTPEQKAKYKEIKKN